VLPPGLQPRFHHIRDAQRRLHGRQALQQMGGQEGRMHDQVRTEGLELERHRRRRSSWLVAFLTFHVFGRDLELPKAGQRPERHAAFTDGFWVAIGHKFKLSCRLLVLAVLVEELGQSERSRAGKPRCRRERKHFPSVCDGPRSFGRKRGHENCPKAPLRFGQFSWAQQSRDGHGRSRRRKK
jgi:hypothetical protein